MSALEKVDISYNCLEFLPLCIFQLPNLVYLNLKQNKLTNLGHHEVCMHTFIPPTPKDTSLSLAAFRLKKSKEASGFDWIMSSLTQNTGKSIQFLDVSNNSIQLIPHEWTKNTYKEFRISSNPLSLATTMFSKAHHDSSNPVLYPPVTSLKCICMNFLLSQWYRPQENAPIVPPSSVHSLPASIQHKFTYSLRCHSCRTPYTTDTCLNSISGLYSSSSFDYKNWNLGGIQMVEYDMIRVGSSHNRRSNLSRGNTVPSLVRFCGHECLNTYREARFLARVSALRNHRPRRFRFNNRI
jgi:hypothetical protein